MRACPGAQISPRIRLVELLAEGGMATVWSAEHADFGKRVAVKVLSEDLLHKDPSLRERLEREASIARALDSPHAVSIHEIGETTDGTPYIVMELLRGIDLGRAVLATGVLEIGEVAGIVRQTAEVLARAHDDGIVHRDVKPDNIFLCNAGHDVFVKVLDFGIAKNSSKAVAQLTAAGTIIGTPEFMAPEQAFNSKDVDHRADLFALGMVAYFALTGELPHSAENPMPHWRLQQKQPIPITEKRDDLPVALDDWFERALALLPDKRFQSAAQMASAFDAIVSGFATQATARPARVWSDDPPTSRTSGVPDSEQPTRAFEPAVPTHVRDDEPAPSSQQITAARLVPPAIVQRPAADTTGQRRAMLARPHSAPRVGTRPIFFLALLVAVAALVVGVLRWG